MNDNLERVAAVLLAVTAGLAASCSDQGAVRSEPPAPAVAKPSSLPPVPAHGDGAAALPPGHPPIDGAAPPAAGLPPVPEGAASGDRGLAWTVPPGWTVEKPASSMRRAQYRVPGEAGDGECVVFYFGPGQGGDPISNAERWADQFTRPDGSPARSAMTTSTIHVGGREVLIVDVAGTYQGGMTMTAAPAVAKPGYRLLGAVVPGPDANWYFKLTGPERTVSEQRDAFTSMVRSMKPGASESK